MKKVNLLFLLLTILVNNNLQAQTANIINASETERIEKFLSSDDLHGRKTYSKDIDKAANFIANEFKQAGLVTFNKSEGYLQTFSRLNVKFISEIATLDGTQVDMKNVIIVTSEPTVLINETSGYEIVKINKEDNLGATAKKFLAANKNYMVVVDESFANYFTYLNQLKSGITAQQKTIVFLLSKQIPTQFSIQATHQIENLPLTNVVGVLPGKTLSNEYVIFSGHYDHLGIGVSENGDSIYNGANDDAAGTTAMIMLSKYFKEKNNNARTLIFVAFTAEEIGGLGSAYFSKQLNPTSVIAMFNLEMIGTESKWGKNSAYITGYEKSNMGAILQKNLEGSTFKFYPDPYTDQNLFYRSDNARLARLGVPAHTISTSKMDNEPNYHKPSDEFKTLDIENMNEIIKAIALSSQSIVAGKDTPNRVETTSLK